MTDGSKIKKSDQLHEAAVLLSKVPGYEQTAIDIAQAEQMVKEVERHHENKERAQKHDDERLLSDAQSKVQAAISRLDQAIGGKNPPQELIAARAALIQFSGNLDVGQASQAIQAAGTAEMAVRAEEGADVQEVLTGAAVCAAEYVTSGVSAFIGKNPALMKDIKQLGSALMDAASPGAKVTAGLNGGHLFTGVFSDKGTSHSLIDKSQHLGSTVA